MSQSDYIRFKRSAQVLRAQVNHPNDLPPVLDPSDYTSFESYNLETTIPNTKVAFSRLHLPNERTIFDMEKNVEDCASFLLCNDTNTRPNRVLNTAEYIVVNGVEVPYTPAPTYRLNKVFIPTICSFTLKNGAITRRAWCGKKVCKCKTRIYTQPTLT